MCVLIGARQHCAAQSARTAAGERESDSKRENRQGDRRKTMRETLRRVSVQIIPMSKMILRLAPIEYFAVDTLLVVTLAVAAVANAWCLSAYL